MSHSQVVKYWPFVLVADLSCQSRASLYWWPLDETQHIAPANSGKCRTLSTFPQCKDGFCHKFVLFHITVLHHYHWGYQICTNDNEHRHINNQTKYSIENRTLTQELQPGVWCCSSDCSALWHHSDPGGQRQRSIGNRKTHGARQQVSLTTHFTHHMAV